MRYLVLILLPAVAAAALLAAFAPSGNALDTPVTPPAWLASITAQSQVAALSDPEAAKPELSGLGHKFELFGAMIRDTDPENAVGNPGGSGGGVGGNEVISANVTPGTLAFAYRALPPGIKITALTNQIGLKYYFVAPKTCAAGSPRVTLLVDAEGDGDTDFAAHGHVNPPAYAGCIQDKWRYEDLTDDLPRWEVTPGGAVPGIPVFPFTPWKAFAATVTAAFPNHRVTAGFLLDGESCSFGVAANCGKAYYDLLTIENRTLEIWQDTVQKG
jgi:hypothetical protein